MNEHRRLYHHEYNKQYYLKKKMSKSNDDDSSKFKKMNSLESKTQRIIKQLQATEARMNQFREELKSARIV
jgi:hypothetical protein